MSSFRALVTAAIPLRAVNYQDADRIVTFLTMTHGKRVLFAHGARKSLRRMLGVTEPFRIVEIRFTEGAGERLGRLIEGRVLESFEALTADLHSLYWGSFGMELVAELVPEHDELSHLFSITSRFLGWLCQEDRGAWYVEVGTMRYVLSILEREGLMPSLACCSRTGAKVDEIERALFSRDSGELFDARVMRPGERVVGVSREARRFMSTVLSGKFPSDSRLETLREARSLVVDLIATLVGKQLRSLSVLHKVWL